MHKIENPYCYIVTKLQCDIWVLNPQAVNLAYDVLAPNIFMEGGKLLGLKIYPSQQT